MAAPGFTLAELAQRVGAELHGDGGVRITRVGTLEHAGPDAIAFLSGTRYRSLLAGTRAGAVIVMPADAAASPTPKLVHANPYATYAKVAALLHPASASVPGIDAAARVDPTAVVAPTATVGPFAVIGARAQVGDHAVIGAGAFVGDDVSLGDAVQLHPRAVVYARCVVGPRTVLHAGAVVGSEGFGMAQEAGRWIKIPQVGRVVIGADCDIGANTTIDRGAIDDTVLEDDVKLDNQIQVGHNCRIGAHTAIAGCVGIAGSAHIGRHVQIGGAAMIGGHLTIPDHTIIAGATAVISTIKAPGMYNGSFPLLTHRDWTHVASEVRRMRTLADRVATLERALRAQSEHEGDSR